MSGAVGLACCWLVAGVFAVSAVGKSRTSATRAAFRRSLADMGVLPAGAVGVVAAVVPVAEAAAVVLIVPPPTAVLGSVLVLALLAAFTAGIGIVLRRGTQAGCLCFGTTERPYGPRHLVRNGVLAAAALTGALTSGQPLDLPAALIAVAAGAIAALVLVLLDELLDLFATPAQRG